MAVRRVSRAARAAVLAMGLGGLAVLLSACTLSARPTVIPDGTSTGQTVGTFTLSVTASDGVFTTQTVDFDFSIKGGHGSVALTPTADAAVVPQTTGTVVAPYACYSTTFVTPSLVCPDVSHVVPPPATPNTPVTPNGQTAGPGTLTISGVKVNATAAAGELVVTVYYPPYTKVTALVAVYTTGVGGSVAAPTFHSLSSATFVAGRPGGFWVRLHGPAVLSLEDPPSWLSISPHAGYLHGTPPANAAGRYTFTILASTNPRTTQRHGDDLTAEQSFTLTVVKP